MNAQEKENLQQLLLKDNEVNTLPGIQLIQAYEPDENLWAIVLYLLLSHQPSSKLYQELWAFTREKLVANHPSSSFPYPHFFR